MSGPHFDLGHVLGRLVSLGVRVFAEIGGLMSFGADGPVAFRHGAKFVQRILQGKQPKDLPIEQPTKFELVINLKTAKAIGLTIPETFLQRADALID
jgi:putative ABC transport system substrate-binding protein